MDLVLEKLISIIARLKVAILTKDKKEFLAIYLDARELEYNHIHCQHWEDFEELLDQANDILYS